ncbi:VanZ family protein [Streptomyces sp. CMB-StM0423]|uniref:VanZ family protein n=1 Tax=Streptomyces sp. CMB-StM0423 TaxID=2059884 RepID=UPI001F1895C3|nr:VanZ family protein [Streptomyces sp. CMB-StM0423]
MGISRKHRDPAAAADGTTAGTTAGEDASAEPPAGAAPVARWVRVGAMLVAFALMVAFAVVLARLTLEESSAAEPMTHTNLRPGDSIRDYLTQPAFVDTVRQLGGNILLGVPFGLLLPVLVPPARGLLRVGLCTAAVMTAVEVVQGTFLTGRAFDIDDVILNTTGAFLGYLSLGRRLGRAVHPPRRRWWHRLFRGPRPAG